jgi:Zn finger protein HypA/HybF involved in hydrogenase expression
MDRMHEAGLARGVAKALRERGLRPGQVRLAVRGGHHDAAEFEAELRAHLAAEMPDETASIAALEVRRLPFGHLCPSCGVEFESERVAPACPKCGVDTLAEVTDEVIEIELMAAVR